MPTVTKMPLPTDTPRPTPTPTGPQSRLDNQASFSMINFITGERIMLPTPNGVLRSAAWSSNGKRILIAWTNQREKKIIDTGFKKGIACDNSTNKCWTTLTSIPDKTETRIMEDYGGGLRLLGRNGEGVIELVSGNDFDAFKDAVWSPNEQKIAALYRFNDGNQCPVILAATGGGITKLNNCEMDDHPRFWSVDGKWIVVWSERGLTLYAYEVDGNQRVPLQQLGKIQVYDQRYWPWRVVDAPSCKGASFWDCE
jgi:Tol biopolymer transport system component